MDNGLNGDARTGDGIYSGSLSLSEPGNYLLAATVSGTNRQGQAFNLRDVKRVEVTAPDLRLGGAFQDAGVDSNGDGLLDQIKLTLTTTGTARTDREYYISLVLQNASGASLVATSTPDAPLEVRIPTQPEDPFTPDLIGYPTSLKGLGPAGPIKVIEARLYRALPGSSFPETLLDVRQNLGTLTSYDLQTLQSPLTSIADVIAVDAVDINGNGKYDQIRFSVNVLTRLPTQGFSYSAELQAPDGQTLDVVSGLSSVVLSPGPNTLPINFSGFSVGASGKNGPYILANLLIYPDNSNAKDATAYSEVVGQTPAWTASQFEGYIEPATTPLWPMLKCVRPNGDGSFTAFFGYINSNRSAVHVAVGNSNKFTPGPLDRGQPKVFQPGRPPYHPNAAFSIRFDGNNLVWNLLGRTSTASRNSTPCTP